MVKKGAVPATPTPTITVAPELSPQLQALVAQITTLTDVVSASNRNIAELTVKVTSLSTQSDVCQNELKEVKKSVDNALGVFGGKLDEIYHTNAAANAHTQVVATNTKLDSSFSV